MKISPRDRLIFTIAGAALLVARAHRDSALPAVPEAQRAQRPGGRSAGSGRRGEAAARRAQGIQGPRDRDQREVAAAHEPGARHPRPARRSSSSCRTPRSTAASSSSPCQPADIVPRRRRTRSIPVSVEVLGIWADTVDYLQALLKLDRGVRVLNSRQRRRRSRAQANCATRRLPKLPPYAVDTVINMEAYMIPSSTHQRPRHRPQRLRHSREGGTHGRQPEWRTACFAVTRTEDRVPDRDVPVVVDRQARSSAGSSCSLVLVAVGALAFFFLLQPECTQTYVPPRPVRSARRRRRRRVGSHVRRPSRPLDETFTFRNIFAPTVTPPTTPDERAPIVLELNLERPRTSRRTRSC